jgi:hypothetical protein
MSGFRTFFIGSVKGGQNAPTNTDESQKWDVVLFVGNYDPITKDEHERIKQFVAKVIKGEQAHKFTHDVDIGVLINEQLEEESYFEEKHNSNLSFEDKEFITGKLFGLKIFPVNFKQLMWLTMEQLDREATQDSKEKINKIVSKIQSSFEKANILIVLREDDSHSLQALGEIIHKFSNNEINIGFMVWKHEPVKNSILENIPFSGEIIKAICLMDFERPEPEELKSFSYKYRLSKHLDSIRTIHFKVHGEKYLLPFTSLFPDLVIYGDEEFEDKKNNYIFVMEILKKMYLGDEYENKLDTRDDKKKPVSSGSTSGGMNAGGPSGGMGSAGGSDDNSTSKPEEPTSSDTEISSTETSSIDTSGVEPELPA